MTDKDVVRYLQLVDRKLSILTAGIHWKPEYVAQSLKRSIRRSRGCGG